MNSDDDGRDLDAMLRHLGSGCDFREFPGTTAEKLGLIRTAVARGLIEWKKTRARYELTSHGWNALMPARRFGVASLMIGVAVGGIAGAAALAILLPADVPPRTAGAQSLQPRSAEPVVRSLRPQQAILPVVLIDPDETAGVGPPTPVVSAPDPPKVEPPSVGAQQAAVGKSHRKTAHRRRRGVSIWAYVRPSRAYHLRHGGYGGRRSWFRYR